MQEASYSATGNNNKNSGLRQMAVKQQIQKKLILEIYCNLIAKYSIAYWDTSISILESYNT